MFLVVPPTLVGMSDQGEPDYARALRAVSARMAQKGLSQIDLARRTDLDPGTVGDFLSGLRWPRRTTRNRIEQTLDFPPNLIQDIAEGVVEVDGFGQLLKPAVIETDMVHTRATVGISIDNELRHQRPPGLSDEVWEETKVKEEAYFRFLIAEATKER